MKKSTITPKELGKKRTGKFMKTLKNEGKICNKENEKPQLINVLKNNFEIHDRDIKDHDFPNPFDLTDHMRIFSKSTGQRKVKPEPFIMSEPHTICDIDYTFYKIIEGRHLRQFSDVKVYIRNIRDITLFKANTAYLNDQIIQMDTSLSFEIEQYDKIEKLYKQTKTNFIQFAEESYEQAKIIQIKADVKSFEVAKAIEQLESLSFRSIKLNNQLSSLIFSFETLSMYGKFLNSLSPDWWRAEFDNLNDTRDSICSAKFPSKVTFLAPIEAFETGVSKLKQTKPHIYFKKPKQIMAIYDGLSRQCLNYMQIDIFARNIVNSVKKCRDDMKTKVKAEIKEIEEFIDIFERNVKFLEEKETDYKVLFEKLLLSEFQRLFASHETTKLFTCVQYVNTRIFGGSEDPKDSVMALMHQMEMLYIELTSELDNLNQDVVKAATTKLFADDIKIMKQAHLAQRTLKECNILSKALYTSFETPRHRRNVTKKDARIVVEGAKK